MLYRKLVNHIITMVNKSDIKIISAEPLINDNKDCDKIIFKIKKILKCITAVRSLAEADKLCKILKAYCDDLADMLTKTGKLTPTMDEYIHGCRYNARIAVGKLSGSIKRRRYTR